MAQKLVLDTMEGLKAMLTIAEISRNIERMTNGELFPFEDSMLVDTKKCVKNSLIAIDVYVLGLPNIFSDNSTYTLELFGSKNDNMFFIPTVLVNYGTKYATSMGVARITDGMKDVFSKEVLRAALQDCI